MPQIQRVPALEAQVAALRRQNEQLQRFIRRDEEEWIRRTFIGICRRGVVGNRGDVQVAYFAISWHVSQVFFLHDDNFRNFASFAFFLHSDLYTVAQGVVLLPETLDVPFFAPIFFDCRLHNGV